MEKWTKKLNLESHTIKLVFHKDQYSYGNYNPNMVSVANTSSLPEYKDHTMNINLEWVNTATKEDVDRKVCHEVLHIAYAPMYNLIWKIAGDLSEGKKKAYREWITSTNEFVTTEMALALTKND